MGIIERIERQNRLASESFFEGDASYRKTEGMQKCYAHTSPTKHHGTIIDPYQKLDRLQASKRIAEPCE